MILNPLSPPQATSSFTLADVYTHTQAVTLLQNVTKHSVRSRLYKWIQLGTIRRVHVAGRVAFGYLKTDVDTLASALHPSFDHERYYTIHEVRALFGDVVPSTVLFHLKKSHVQKKLFVAEQQWGYLKLDVDALITARCAPRFEGRTPDADAFTRLYAAVFERGVAYLVRRFRFDDTVAQDVIQEAFVDLWRLGSTFFADYSEPAAQEHVIFRHFYTEALAYLEARRAKRTGYDVLVPDTAERFDFCVADPAPSVEAQVIARETWQELQRKLSRESLVMQQAVYRFALGYTYEEILTALQQMGARVSSVMSISNLLWQARQRLHDSPVGESW